MQLAISALSKPGGREPNEDAFGCWSSPAATFCLLCDGAGGHGGGEVASKLAVRVALNRFQQQPDAMPAALEGAVRAAHAAIIAGQAGGEHVARMRSTAVVLAMDMSRNEASWAHVGDTRLYCFRAGRIIGRTIDHSVVQRMVDAGYIAERDLRSAPERNRLYAALGQVENFSPVVNGPLRLQPGDAFLLCTDGFWSAVEDDTMLATLAGARDTEAWLAGMEREVLARAGRDHDNYSALAIWCDEGANDAPALVSAGAAQPAT